MDKKIRIGVMGCADIAQRLVIPLLFSNWAKNLNW